MADRKTVIEVAGREVAVSHPQKVYFPRTGHTKLDLVRYYLAVADGALRGAAGRPMALKRFVNGAEEEPFFQKRAPSSRPAWIETVELSFPSGRTAEEVVIRDAAGLAWVANLGCIDLNPHPVLTSDLDHPDELRVDLDPVPGVQWPQIIAVALQARAVLADFGLTGWAKTSGSRGMHIYARISPSWPFGDVRRAAVAVAREIERRVPDLATSKWCRCARRRLAGQGGGGVQPEVSVWGGPEEPEDALVPRCQLPVGDFEGGEDAAGGIPAVRATRVHVLQFVDQLV